MNLRTTYALSEKVRLHGMLPLRGILAPKTDVNSGDRYLREFSGVGDVLVSATYLAYSSRSSAQTVVAVTSGLRLPTGDSNPDHDWGYGNSRDPVLQPGYGTVDPLFGLSMSRKLGKYGVSLSAVTRLSGGTNVHGYRYADEYQGTLGVTRDLAAWIDAGLSGAVLTSAHDFDNGVMVQNTGGLWGYLIPQMTLKSKGVKLEPSVMIPVYSFVNGGQLVSDAIYTLSLSLVVGRRSLAGSRTEGVNAMSKVMRPSNLQYGSSCGHCGLSGIVHPLNMTLIEIMSDACGACQDFEPSLARFAVAHPDIAIRQVDYFSLTQIQIAELEIAETPTLLLYAPDGSLIEQVNGTDLKRIESHLR